MSLTLVAISLTAMAGVGAVAVDLGMLYKARADAQRAAEAAALAGASAFLDYASPPSARGPIAEARARALAQANTILNTPVAAGEVEVEVDPNPSVERVGVRVRRAGIGTWFARLFGESSAPVGAFAAAATTEAGGVICVSPIMLPDVWDETDPTQDPNGSNWEDQGEQWSYTPVIDPYGPFDPAVSPGGQTGYGSSLRSDYDRDYGRQVTLRPQPEDPLQPAGPGHYRLWTYDGENPDISPRLQSCDQRPVGFGAPDYDIVPSSVPLPLGDISDLIDADDGASWNASQNTIQGSTYSDWRQSPRVIKIALFNPGEIADMQSGQSGPSSSVQFNNVVLFFLEGVDQGQGTVTGRLLYYSGGNSDEGASGALVKRVRLVE